MSQNEIKYLDDLPKDALAALKMLNNLFEETDFAKQIPTLFLKNYNKAGRILDKLRKDTNT